MQQPPLCVLPADRLDSIQTFSPDRRVGTLKTAGEMERFKDFANVIDDRRYGLPQGSFRSSVLGAKVLGSWSTGP